MIQGIITTHDVLRHPSLIVRSFGFRTYIRCLSALAMGRRTTFLELVFAP